MMNNDYLKIGNTMIRKSDIREIDTMTIKVPILKPGYDARGMKSSFLHGYSEADKQKYGIKTQNESLLFPGEDYKIYNVLLIVSTQSRTYCVSNEEFFVDDVSVALDFMNHMVISGDYWHTELKANEKMYRYDSGMLMNIKEYLDMCEKVSEQLYAYNKYISIIKSDKKLQDILNELNT